MIDPSIIKTLATGGGGAAIPIALMFAWFTPHDEYIRHVAEARTGNVLDIISEIKASESNARLHDTLCNALREELAMICADAPTHSFCLDRQIILDDSGCQSRNL